jgi:hypothetical protein
MYPPGTKNEKVMSNYVQVVQDYGSDWIGNQQEETILKPGHYKITVQIKWVVNAVRDYSISVYSEKPILIKECIKPGTGNFETKAGYFELDECFSLRLGFVYKDGDPLDIEDIKEKRVDSLHQDLQSMDSYLLGQISDIYWQMDQLSWLEKEDKGWYYQYTG